MKDRFRAFIGQAYGTVFSPLTLAVWVSSIVVAVVAGPFGTLEGMSVGQRIVFWGATVSVSVFVGYTVRAAALGLVGTHRPGLSDWVSVLMMTAVFAPFVQGLADAVGNAAPGMARMFADVFVVTGAVFVVRRAMPGIEMHGYRFFERGRRAAPVATARRERRQPRLMRRLPATARGRILRLAARDHRVDVVTERGTTPLRIRLRDAIDEMDPEPGHCTHRSHWVARWAIRDVERDGAQKFFVILVNGDRVPVSRKYRADLEEAGVIALPDGAGDAASAWAVVPVRSAPPPPPPT